MDKYGWQGKILHIDLSKQQYHVEEPPEEVYRKYIGGRGLAGFYLTDCITLAWDAPEMPLLFFTGPLVNTAAPASGRMTVMSRSPYTGTVGDASVGGKLGSTLKKAGYDGLVIRGRAGHWCGLEIRDDEVRFEDATALYGKTIPETRAALGRDGSTAVIGPAAENGVCFSSICIDDHYFAGRNGLGLVMAGKRLKFLHVTGSRQTGVFDAVELKLAREEIFRLTSASPALKGEFGLATFGTGALYDLIHARRMMPTDNFRKTRFEDAASMNAWQYAKQYLPKHRGCAGCHIVCKKVTAAGEALPEYETMAHFSALICNRDIGVVMEANRICNATGMDTISAAGTLACYRELSGRVLSGQDVLTLLRDMAYSRGVGAQLKYGSYQYALAQGNAAASITVKGQELPAYDPRGAYGMALAYATSTRGACHLRAYPIAQEILRKPVDIDRLTFSGKARIVKIGEDLNAVIDSLTACKFLFFAATLEEYARAFYGVTGVKTTAQDLLKTGERIFYRERLMNAWNGFTAQADDLPPRFFVEPGSSGDGIEVKPLSREEFLLARVHYYKVRGLTADGMPVKEKCEELGIAWKDF